MSYLLILYCIYRYSDIKDDQERLTQALFNHIPVGVGSKGVIPTRASDLVDSLEMGMDWSLRQGYSWAEDKVLLARENSVTCRRHICLHNYQDSIVFLFQCCCLYLGTGTL